MKIEFFIINYFLKIYLVKLSRPKPKKIDRNIKFGTMYLEVPTHPSIEI
tara:strand:+ start:541 stop:687 length:147 start_codon:yes stop_codon:yes gene_type:complete